jgi:hypothetical protein
MRKQVTPPMRSGNSDSTRDRLEMLLEANHEMNHGERFHGVVAVISPGELVDKITILEIKSKKIIDPDKKSHIDYELSTLTELYNKIFSDVDQKRIAEDIKKQLLDINSLLWGFEELIRELQRNNDFSERYISTSVGISRNNDLRHRLKHEIDKLLNSCVSEQKSHKIASDLPCRFFNAKKSVLVNDTYCGFRRGFLL